MIPARYIVAVVLLVFAWKGAEVKLQWPPAPQKEVVNPAPGPELLAWAEPLRPILPKMLPADRQYLSALYDAMVYVLMRDGERDNPIVTDTEKFSAFHAGTLRLAIDKASVGKYPGLAEAIDQTFLAAAGAEVRPMDKDTRARLTAACGVLSWTFGMGRNE